MINQVVLVGRITKDVELKTTQSNIPVATFTLAVNRQFSSDNGEREADFIQCVAWRKAAENMAQFVNKGDLLGVQGRIQTRQYESEQGMKYITEVVCDTVQFLETKRDEKKEVKQDYATVDKEKKRVQDEADMKKYNIDSSELPF